MVAAELAQQTSLELVAQSVVDRVKRLHHDVFASGHQRAPLCTSHEDMTLLLRTFNYPLADGALTPTQGRSSLPTSRVARLSSIAAGHTSGRSSRSPHRNGHEATPMSDTHTQQLRFSSV